MGRVRGTGGRSLSRGAPKTIIEVIWYLDDDTPPEEVVYAVENCACGEDHLTVPLDADGLPMICREHKRHEPCRPCLRRRTQGCWGGHV